MGVVSRITSVISLLDERWVSWFYASVLCCSDSIKHFSVFCLFVILIIVTCPGVKHLLSIFPSHLPVTAWTLLLLGGAVILIARRWGVLPSPPRLHFVWCPLSVADEAPIPLKKRNLLIFIRYRFLLIWYMYRFLLVRCRFSVCCVCCRGISW